MRPSVREMPELELALMRRGVGAMTADCERCARCERTPLVGERVYEYESGRLVCELCRGSERKQPVDSHVVHSSELGHAVRIKIIDQRPAAT
jgi:hypothetical protein